MSYNPTEPLPYDSSDNSLIYNPFSSSCIDKGEDEDKQECLGGQSSFPLKKARRVVSANSLSAFLQRAKKEKRFGSSSSSRSSKPSRWFRGNVYDGTHSVGNVCNSQESSPLSSDLESLPDLTDDDADTPETTPIKASHKFTFLDTISPGRKLVFSGCGQQEESLPSKSAGESIFDVPELVHRILLFVEAQNDCQPREHTPIRRKPLSYNHALLIYGDKELAQQAMAEDNKQQKQEQQQYHHTPSNPLFNCLLVNKLFNRITREILAKTFYFSNDTQFQKYITAISSPNIVSTPIQFQPQLFNLHKLFHSNQSLFNKAICNNINFHNLTSFELFMCPKIYPSWEIFQTCGQKLKTLVITGSKTIDNDFCFMISQYCQNLTHLDLRACELISDSGLYQIAKTNHNLQQVNVGRKNKGYLISDVSIMPLIKNNVNLHTLGLAGTYISDVVMWQMGHSLKLLSRLSLNNCPRLTNSGLTHVLNQPHVFPHLTVLELRFNLQLTDLTSLIHFKNRKTYQYYHQREGETEASAYGELLLVELCETLMYRMRRQELDLDKLISNKIMNDILFWINDQWENDGDLSYIDLLNSRKRKRQ